MKPVKRTSAPPLEYRPEAVTRARRALGLTQEKLADALHCSRNLVARMEREGATHIEALALMALARDAPPGRDLANLLAE